MAFDRTDPADLLALKNEVTLDPNGYGYVPADTTAVLEMINQVRATITVQNSSVAKSDVKASTLYDAFDGLLAPEQAWLEWITSGGGDEIKSSADVREHLLGDGGSSIWAVADRTAMEAAMVALFDRDGSRAEELFGENTTITRNDWLAARD